MGMLQYLKNHRQWILKKLQGIFVLAFIFAIIGPELPFPSPLYDWIQSVNWLQVFLWSFLFGLISGIQLEMDVLRDSLGRIETSLTDLRGKQQNVQ